jgi:cell division protein FtsZ
MSKGGLAVMLIGESKQQNKAESVIRDCLAHPLLDIDFRGATGGLIHITGGNDLTLHDAEEIAQQLTYELDPHADVIWGARVRKDFEGKVSVMAIMTGIHSPQIIGGSSEPRVIGRSQPQVQQSDAAPSPASHANPEPIRTSGGNFDWII